MAYLHKKYNLAWHKKTSCIHQSDGMEDSHDVLLREKLEF